MTYLDYLNDFNQWLESNPLPGNAQLLYFRLLNVFNRAGWPEQVQVDTLRLMLLADCQKDAAYRARERLREAGFLTYRKGKKGAPTVYFLSDRTTESATESATENATESATENATHIKTKKKTKNIPPLPPEGGKRERKRFIPPTVEEVRAYCEERREKTGICIDPEAFVAWYASKGWMVGKSKMKDWKQAVITWERKRVEAGQADSPDPPQRRRLVLTEDGEGAEEIG